MGTDGLLYQHDWAPGSGWLGYRTISSDPTGSAPSVTQYYSDFEMFYVLANSPGTWETRQLFWDPTTGWNGPTTWDYLTSAPAIAQYNNSLHVWSRDAKSYPFVTTSLYEKDADPGTLYTQGCTAGGKSTQGVAILDFGRPAYDSGSNTYGTIDFEDAYISYAQILTGAENYARGHGWCHAGGHHLYIAIGTNNSCSDQDPSPRCVGAGYQPPSFGTAGRQLDDTVVALQGYISSNPYGAIETASAADDTEPTYDPGPVGCTTPCSGGHAYEFLVGYDQEDGGTGTTHYLWD